MKTSAPNMLYIKIPHPQITGIPLSLLNDAYTDYLKSIEGALGIYFDFIQTKENHLSIYCSSPYPLEKALLKRKSTHQIEISSDQSKFKFKNYRVDFEDEALEKIEKALQEITEKIHALFEVQIKTPIEIQWELL